MQATNVGKTLLLPPIVGFICAAALLLLARKLIPQRRLYESPKTNEPPPFWIRALLILTCTGVSFAHGSNDGQKGMGLIMLILVGVVPTAYALHRAVTVEQTQDFVAVSQQAVSTLHKYVEPGAVMGDPTEDVTEYIASRHFKPGVTLALRQLVNDLSNEVAQYKAL